MRFHRVRSTGGVSRGSFTVASSTERLARCHDVVAGGSTCGRAGEVVRLIRSEVGGDDCPMTATGNLQWEVECRPVTEENAADLVRFSEQHGKFRYCSCMRWRMTSTEYTRSTKEGRIAELDALAGRGEPVGVIAYLAGEPVGWCAIAPRENYRALERFRALPRLDDQAVWSVVCFFVDRRVRRAGLTSRCWSRRLSTRGRRARG